LDNIVGYIFQYRLKSLLMVLMMLIVYYYVSTHCIERRTYWLLSLRMSAVFVW